MLDVRAVNANFSPISLAYSLDFAHDNVSDTFAQLLVFVFRFEVLSRMPRLGSPSAPVTTSLA